MVSALTTTVSLALIVVLLASVLGAVTRTERVWFVAGVALVILTHTGGNGLGPLAGLIALVGLAMVFASTIPLLRQPA